MNYFGPKCWVEVYGFPLKKCDFVLASVKKILQRKKFKVTGEKNCGDYLIIYLHRDALEVFKCAEEAFRIIEQIEDFLIMTFGRSTNAFVTIEMGKT